MKDTSLYQQILGDTAPWEVTDVRLDADSLSVHVALSLRPEVALGCPNCEGKVHIKEWRTRRWRHLDSCQFKIILEASVPVVECSEHGVRTVQVPWADKSSRFYCAL